MILLLLFVFLVVAIGVGAVLVQNGMLPGASGDGVRLPHLPELPQGCLLALIVGAAVWFVLWGIVLILALRFLRTPLG